MKTQSPSREQALTSLPGVGPQRLAQLNKLGLFSMEDLLRYFPRDYEDRRTIRPIQKTKLLTCSNRERAVFCPNPTVCRC